MRLQACTRKSSQRYAFLSMPQRKQEKIAERLDSIDNLITLHQRELFWEENMTKINRKELFIDYFENWINIYKEGSIRKVTMLKYRLSLSWLKKLAPKLKMCDIDN